MQKQKQKKKNNTKTLNIINAERSILSSKKKKGKKKLEY